MDFAVVPSPAYPLALDPVAALVLLVVRAFPLLPFAALVGVEVWAGVGGRGRAGFVVVRLPRGLTRLVLAGLFLTAAR